MNEWERLHKQAERYRVSHPPGTRVVLDHMSDPYAPVPSGTKGTVLYVDDASQIHIKWDNGSGLALIPGEDSFRKLTEQEIYEEKAANGTLTEAEKVQQLREQYPKGSSIEYLGIGDIFSNLPPGIKGTVEGVDSHGNILMKWENGSTLALIPKTDSFRKYEPTIVQLGDDCKIVLPDKPVDCSKLGFFDELEEECWQLMKSYCAKLGIEMLPDEDGEIPISFDIAKEIQDTILIQLDQAGVKMDFEGDINESEDNTPAMRM